jgi:hypothetical protein
LMFEIIWQPGQGRGNEDWEEIGDDVAVDRTSPLPVNLTRPWTPMRGWLADTLRQSVVRWFQRASPAKKWGWNLRDDFGWKFIFRFLKAIDEATQEFNCWWRLHTHEVIKWRQMKLSRFSSPRLQSWCVTLDGGIRSIRGNWLFLLFLLSLTLPVDPIY